MATHCNRCPLRKLDCFEDLPKDGLRAIERFKGGELHIEPKTPILSEGSSAAQVYTVQKGMGIRYKMLENGRRQVVSFVFPGDFLGLQAGVMGEMGHSVEASTNMILCVFDRSELWNFFKSDPALAFDLTWLAANEEHFLGSALATLGQRTARQRVCWAIHRIYMRGEALGLHTDQGMPFPFRQQDLADSLGLSLVHTNKTLASLKEKQIAAWSDGVIRVRDIDALAEIAMIDDEPIYPRPLI